MTLCIRMAIRNRVLPAGRSLQSGCHVDNRYVIISSDTKHTLLVGARFGLTPAGGDQKYQSDMLYQKTHPHLIDKPQR